MLFSILMTKTIFCDIDGTILMHKNNIFNNILEQPVILKGVIDNFKEWDKNNFKIILTTGRKESYRKETENQLNSLGIPYDNLIMGLPNGERIVINDRKLNSINSATRAIDVIRNQGLENINLISPTIYTSSKIEKPWGYEEIIEHNYNYVVKKIFMKANNSCSTQYHELKTETIVVLEGNLNIYTGSSLNNLICKLYTKGESITILPYTIHKMEALTDSIYMETSTDYLWDVVRLQDNYGRVNS